MSSFSYIAKNKDAQTQRGVIEAVSQKEAIHKLQTKGLFVIAISSSRAKQEKQQAPVKNRKYGHSKIKLSDLSLLARQLGTLISSGVPLLRSVEITSYQCESKQMETILKKMSNDIKEGLSVTESISKYPKVFSSLWRGLIDTGEASGNLSQVLERLAEYLELREDFMRKLVSAVMYPIVLLIAAAGALAAFTFFILPKFQGIFDQANVQLPFITQIIFGFSNFVKDYFFIILILIAGLLFSLKFFLSRTEPGKRIIDSLSLKLPVVRDFFRIYYLERFSSTSSILFQSGVPIVYGLEVIERSMGNIYLESILRKVKEEVRNGASFSGELSKHDFFPPLVVEMAAIGEEVGNFPEMFQKISFHYRIDLQTKVERTTSLFEPIMIIFVAIIIGLIVIALFLPLFQLSQAYR
jgi:type IV pilus assembly protein PilC